MGEGQNRTGDNELRPRRVFFFSSCPQCLSTEGRVRFTKRRFERSRIVVRVKAANRAARFEEA
jgi:hypothetical protein